MKQLTARDMAQIAIVAADLYRIDHYPTSQRYGLLWLSIPCFEMMNF